MCTLCACYLVDCSNGTMDNTAAVILLYRQVKGSAPYNAPLSNITLKLEVISMASQSGKMGYLVILLIHLVILLLHLVILLIQLLILLIHLLILLINLLILLIALLILKKEI